MPGFFKTKTKKYAVAQQLQTWAHRRPEFPSLWSEEEIPVHFSLLMETMLGLFFREHSFRCPHLLCVDWGNGGKFASHTLPPSGACLQHLVSDWGLEQRNKAAK